MQNKIKIYFLFFSLFLGLNACKTKQLVTETRNASTEKTVEVAEIYTAHLTNIPDFSTLVFKTNLTFENEKQTQNAVVDFRIKKDEIIWINVKIVGFPVAKALLTPANVKFYEKGNKTFFDGNYDLLSQWLGTNLDFEKVQNLLLAKTIYPIDNQIAKAVIEAENYYVSVADTIKQAYYFSQTEKFLKKQELIQTEPNRTLSVAYNNFQTVETKIFPKDILIEVLAHKKTTISLEYKNIEVNQNVTFPFEFPKNYQEIIIE